MRKCKCGRPAVFFRKYEGRALCKYHFCQSIESKVKKTIGKAGMVERGDRIVVGLSGGKDSSAVLYLMHKIFGKRPDIKIFALTVDEGIRGYRTRGIVKAKQLCKKLGIKQHFASFKKVFGKTLDQKVKEVRKRKPKIREPCTYCGVGRRYVLNKEARKLGATKLCLGHNLDDETQAVLMNYIRGDLSRAARMGPVTELSRVKKKGNLFVPRIKPLREVPEDEIKLYVKILKIPVYLPICHYKGGLRKTVMKFVDELEKKYSGIKFSILETFDKVLPALRELVNKEEGEIQICKKCGEPGSGEICKACELWAT